MFKHLDTNLEENIDHEQSILIQSFLSDAKRSLLARIDLILNSKLKKLFLVF
jgi:hypothetical protein